MIDEARLVDIARNIPCGQVIPGINKDTRYSFVGLEQYDSHGKALEMDGSLVIALESTRRKRKRIRLFVKALVYFLKDGEACLSYGIMPPSYILEYRRNPKPRIPNLSEYGSHYKSFARYVYSIARRR
jgi:hypothetical protein